MSSLILHPDPRVFSRCIVSLQGFPRFPQISPGQYYSFWQNDRYSKRFASLDWYEPTMLPDKALFWLVSKYDSRETRNSKTDRKSKPSADLQAKTKYRAQVGTALMAESQKWLQGNFQLPWRSALALPCQFEIILPQSWFFSSHRVSFCANQVDSYLSVSGKQWTTDERLMCR